MTSKRPQSVSPQNTSPTNRPRRDSLTTMGTYEDEQRESDQSVLHEIQNIQGDLGDAIPSLWLSQIVDKSRSLKQEYVNPRKSRELLESDHDLLNLLRKCIKVKKFQPIRDYDKLRKSISHTEMTKSEPVNKKYDGALLKASYLAFTQKFVGSADDLFLSTLDHYLASATYKSKPYNLSLSIIQSSGMGKSRLVDKAAEKRLAFPLNLRGENRGIKAYPPSDIAVYEYLRPSSSDTDEDLRIRFLFFLTAMFREAIPIIQTFQGGYQAVVEQWHEYLAKDQQPDSVGSNRRSFYDSVINNAEELLSVHRKADDVRTIVLDMVFKATETLRKTLPEDPPSLDKSSGGNSIQSSGVFCFVYFDEAHTLTEIPLEGDRRERSAYDNLGTALSWLRTSSDPVDVFFVFLSTNSSLRAFAPSIYNHPSARDWTATRLIPPYTELPFDIFPGGMVSRLRKQHALTLEGVCRLDEVVKLGRPIWYSQMSNVKESLRDHIVFAMDKLCTNEGSSDSAKDDQLAALDIRILLGYDSIKPVAREKESKLVERNLRVAYSVPEHREFMRTGYPSEPLLAEAAARFLNGGLYTSAVIKEAKIATRGPEILSAAFGGGFLARGERGEMVARLLLTIAHDMAIISAGPVKLTKEPNFHKPIKVIDFIKALFNEEFHDRILNAKPVSHSGGQKLEDAFKDAYLNFSHFSRAGDSAFMDIENLWLTLLRGNAIQCVGHQKSIDVSMATVFGDPASTVIRKGNTSVLQCQTKNVKDTSIIEIDPTISNPKPSKGNPVLSLVLQLGSKTQSEDSLVEVYNRKHQSTRAYEVDKDPNAYHYQIVAHGCTSKTYAVIPSGCEELYKSILAEGDFADDFPRKELDGNRQALYNLKPEFYGKAEDKVRKASSWNWALSDDVAL